jgi:hypothetical protein
VSVKRLWWSLAYQARTKCSASKCFNPLIANANNPSGPLKALFQAEWSLVEAKGSVITNS